jgi:hypothetical protein
MKNATLPLLLLGGGAVAAYLFTRPKSTGGGTSGGGGVQPSPTKPTLVLPRLAPAPGPTITVLTIDTNGIVREVIPQPWSGANSVIELLVINAANGVPVAEAMAFGREPYDFKTLPTEVADLLNTYFNVTWAP